MLLKYGSYSFNQYTTSVPISRAFTFDSQGRRDKETQTWTITTVLQDTTQSGIKSKIAALEAALVDGSDLILYHNDGTTPSAHAVANCRIGSIGFPKASGAEYANQRTVEISITGEVTSTKADTIVAFQESVSYSGNGGPRYVWQECLTGVPQKYEAVSHTLYRAVQSGSATGRASDPAAADPYPTPPAPLFPAALLEGGIDSAPMELERSTSYDEYGTVLYSIRWTYEFASVDPLEAFPHTWL